MDTLYTGEFGHELVCVIPYAYFHFLKGNLNQTRSMKDTSCFYYFSPNHIEMGGNRNGSTPNTPNKHTGSKTLNKEEWIAPPYKQHYKNNIFLYEKPILVVSNKYNSEWNGPPINFLDLDTLEFIFKTYQDKYQIIYNRPTWSEIVSDVDTRIFECKDIELIKNKYPQVLIIQDIHKKHNYSFNLLQLLIYANTDKFISVQGGNSVLCSYFGDNFIFAKEGREVDNNSYSWYNQIAGFSIKSFNNIEKMIEQFKLNL